MHDGLGVGGDLALMGHDEERVPPFMQPVEKRENLLACRRIQVPGRLVSEKDRGVVHEPIFAGSEGAGVRDRHGPRGAIRDRRHNRFNVAVAEVDFADLWQRSTVGIAVVSSASSHAEEVMSKAIDFIERDGRFQLVDVLVEPR